MLEANELSQIPLRQGNAEACLLASYSAAVFPFSHTPELQYFVDCCSLLGIDQTTQANAINLLRPQLIDQRIGTTKNGSGYDWIEELHQNCQGKSFVKARNKINITRGLTTNEVVEKLRNERSSSIFSLHFPNNAVHSICIIYDQNLGFVARDSGQPLRNPEPIIDATANSLQQLLINLYNIQQISVGESMLIEPK